MAQITIQFDPASETLGEIMTQMLFTPDVAARMQYTPPEQEASPKSRKSRAKSPSSEDSALGQAYGKAICEGLAAGIAEPHPALEAFAERAAAEPQQWRAALAAAEQAESAPAAEGTASAAACAAPALEGLGDALADATLSSALTVNKATVRGLAMELVDAGKQDAVRACLRKYGADSISKVPEERYAAFLADLEAVRDAA